MKEEAEATLIFQWEEKKPRWRLARFAGLSLFLHASCFYFFQIVYPTAHRAMPSPARIALLTRENPAAAAVVHSIEDRISMYFPLEETTPPPEKAGMESPLPRPGFYGHPLHLLSMPEKKSPSAFPRVFYKQQEAEGVEKE